jgi:ABC-type transport system substrate-binding protein
MILVLDVMLVPNALPSKAQSQSNCPANRQLNWTLIGGAPNSLTALTTGVLSGFLAGEEEYWGAYPALGPTGIQYWNESIVDWVQSNANYTQWTLNVKPGLKWSDGSPVTANDILTTYSSQYAFNASFDFTGEHSEVQKAYALNSSAAVFQLNTVDAHFPETISPIVFTSVIPASAATQYGSSYTGFGSPVVVGPFGAVNYQAGQSLMVMARNPYFNTTGLPEPQICQMNVNFVESDADSSTLLQEGATDLANVAPSSVASVLTNPNIHIMNEAYMQITPMTYNLTTYPFNMTAFRQAIAFSVDQNAIVSQAFAGYAGTAYSSEGLVPPIETGLYNPNQTQYSLNTTKALSLLNSIGITKGSDGFLHYPNGTVVSLSVWADTEHAPDVVAAGIVANNLQAIGIQATTNIVARSSITSLTDVAPATMYVVTGEAPIFASASVDALPAWDVYAHPAIPGKYWEYPPSANDQYNANYSIISHTANLTTEAAALKNIEAINAEYLPTIAIAYPSEIFGYSTLHWTNWPTYPNGWVYLNNNIYAQLFADLQPATNSTGTTSTVTSTATGTGSTVTSTTATTVTSVVTSGGSSNTILYIGIAVVVLVVVAVGVLALRRPRSTAPK